MLLRLPMKIMYMYFSYMTGTPQTTRNSNPRTFILMSLSTSLNFVNALATKHSPLSNNATPAWCMNTSERLQYNNSRKSSNCGITSKRQEQLLNISALLENLSRLCLIGDLKRKKTWFRRIYRSAPSNCRLRSIKIELNLSHNRCQMLIGIQVYTI